MRNVPAWIPVTAIVALVALGLGIDRANPSEATARPDPVPAGAAVSGAWYCAVGDTADGAVMRVVAATPPSEATTASDVVIDSFAEGVTARGGEVQVNPGSSARRDLGAQIADVGIAARWWEAPAAISRSVFVQPTGGPEGYLEGPCEPQPSPRWIFPGMATAGGAQAELVLANPFDTDASVTVTFTTPDGLVEPKLLENVVVPKRSTRAIPLNEHAPERADLGVVVTSRSGRVVAEATQTVSAAIGGVDGVSLVKGAAQPAENWTIPWFQVGAEDEVQSWLWVSNLEDRPAALALSFHTSGGGVVPETFDELTVAPGETRRIDLGELVPEGVTRAGVTVRSENSVPVTASVATQLLGSDTPRTGFTIQLGAPSPDPLWVLTGGPTTGRSSSLHLANPGSTPAVVDVRLWSAAGALAPPELQGLTVPPGSLQSTDLTELLPPEADDHTVFVVAREGSVVASRSASDTTGTRRLVAALGVPGSLWSGGEIVPPVAFSSSLTQRLGTDLGPQPPDPITGEEEPAPEQTETEPATVETLGDEPTEPAPAEPSPEPTEPAATEPASEPATEPTSTETASSEPTSEAPASP